MRLVPQCSRPRGTARSARGFTLVELLVALPLAALVVASAALLLVQQLRQVRGAEATGRGVRELRHARLVLETDLAPLRSADLRFVSDTLLEFQAQLGVGIVCEYSASGTAVVAASDSLGTWMSTARAGDRFNGWTWPDSIGATPVAVTAMLGGEPVRAPSGPCGPLPGLQRWRLDIEGPPPSARLAGTPFRLQRLTRYSHYRSGSQWWLGRRSHDLSGWDVVQPVVGPLLSGTAEGMRIHMLDARGDDVASVDSARGLRVELRAPRSRGAWPSIGDQRVRFEVAFRAALTGHSP